MSLSLPPSPAALRFFWLLSLTSAAATAPAADFTISVQKADGSPAADTVVALEPARAVPPQPPTEPVVITQRDLRFVPYVTVVPPGTVLRFSNQDRYDHHVRSMPGGPLGNVPPAQQFELRLKAFADGRSDSADVKVDTPGAITLGCHIHGSMRGHVMVGTSPWTAVTDEHGQVRLRGVPDGAVQLRLWHPDQLVEQPVQTLQSGAAAQLVQATLNFNPRKRRAPAPPPPAR
ncbi:plastocyanin [Ideonella livida]|uniref:Plastocyanin n=1 Tax=Ideonella livida TaxID=2707176 RepID=A0A7C9PEQ4_9BURK|nr:plastocyanin [Ideonella livida]NDY90036.1 plastocyanin [Ideonella livida]